jgi:hypothetical protein
MNYPRISEYRFMEAQRGLARLWIVEASTLEFAPGVWPVRFAVVPVVGGEIVFEKVRQIQGGGWRYEAADGRAIEVLND